ncbi:MAG: acetyltransferase [Methanothrix sp.]|nr:acetyltransferase [Methanothrix sp.]
MSQSQGCYAHPTAIVESQSIGEGTRIWHFAHVRYGSKIGDNCNIGKSVYIDIGAEIGSNVKIQNFVSVYKGVTIEDDVFVGPSATFTNDLYPRAFIWDEDHVSATRICRGASIGANATIVCGITVGRVCHDRGGQRCGRGCAAFRPGAGQSRPAEGICMLLRQEAGGERKAGERAQYLSVPSMRQAGRDRAMKMHEAG